MNIKLKGPLPERLLDIGLRPGLIIRQTQQSDGFPEGYRHAKIIRDGGEFCFTVKPENYTKL